MNKAALAKRGGKYQRGASLVECGLIFALLIVIAVPGIKLLGHRTTEPLCKLSTAMLTDMETQWSLANGTVGSKTKCKSKYGFTTFFEINW